MLSCSKFEPGRPAQSDQRDAIGSDFALLIVENGNATGVMPTIISFNLLVNSCRKSGLVPEIFGTDRCAGRQARQSVSGRCDLLSPNWSDSRFKRGCFRPEASPPTPAGTPVQRASTSANTSSLLRSGNARLRRKIVNPIPVRATV